MAIDALPSIPWSGGRLTSSFYIGWVGSIRGSILNLTLPAWLRPRQPSCPCQERFGRLDSYTVQFVRRLPQAPAPTPTCSLLRVSVG